jgi:hypothetical protein
VVDAGDVEALVLEVAGGAELSGRVHVESASAGGGSAMLVTGTACSRRWSWPPMSPQISAGQAARACSIAAARAEASA